METESLVPDERRSILWSAAAFDEWVAPHLGVMRGLPRARLMNSCRRRWRQRGDCRSRFDERKGSARTWLLTLTADQVR